MLELRPASPDVAEQPLDPWPLLNRAVTSGDGKGGGSDALIRAEPTDVRLRLEARARGSLAVNLPLDRLFEYRLAAAMRLWRSLRGLRPGPDPMPLTPYSRGQLVLVLRALDGTNAGADARDIAAALFGAHPASRRDWLTSDHYSRLRRLLERGRKLVDGGYRRLLRPAPRRPRPPGRT